jgi:putative transposase
MKDREALLAFYYFRALEASMHDKPDREHIRDCPYRTVRSRGCVSNKTALAMIFKLTQAAKKRWHRLRGNRQLPKVILSVM